MKFTTCAWQCILKVLNKKLEDIFSTDFWNHMPFHQVAEYNKTLPWGCTNIVVESKNIQTNNIIFK